MSSKFVAALCGALVLTVAASAAQAGQAEKKESKLKPGVYAHFVTTEGDFTVKFFEQGRAQDRARTSSASPRGRSTRPPASPASRSPSTTA